LQYAAKKHLKMSNNERIKFMQSLSNRIREMVNDGVVLLSPTNASSNEREIGFDTARRDHENGVNVQNSVRKHEELNCKICNHKLDPIYLHHHRSYLVYKTENQIKSLTTTPNIQPRTTLKTAMRWCWMGVS